MMILAKLNSKLRRLILIQIKTLSVIPVTKETWVTMPLSSLKELLKKKKRTDKLWRWTLFLVLVRIRLPRLVYRKQAGAEIIKNFVKKIDDFRYAIFIPLFFRTVMRLKNFISRQVIRRRLYVLLTDAQWIRLEVDMIKKQALSQYERLLLDRERRRPEEKFQHCRKMHRYHNSLYPPNKAARKVLDSEYKTYCTDVNLRLRMIKTIGLIYRRKLLEENELYRTQLKTFEWNLRDWVFLKDAFQYNKSPPEKPIEKYHTIGVPDAVIARAINTARMIRVGEHADQAIGELNLCLISRNLNLWSSV